MRPLLTFVLFLALAMPAFAQESLKVLPDDCDPPLSRLLRIWLLSEAGEHFEARRQTIAALKTPEDIARRQNELREKFLAALGDFPERTPLNPVVVGRVPGDGYSIEKVIYESRPRHHVTASLYLPSGKPPFPGVIMPIGHSNNGKAADYVQRGSILLAKNGIAVLAYDPIGQGERRQLLDGDGKSAIPSSTNEHTLTGIGALLVGRCTANYRVWDGLRSLDYLASRPEIDPKRLGCTGCSGGGTMTSYLMALDPRIVAAAPSCYLTSLERLFATIGPQDGEQNIPGQVAFGLNHADYILLHAPQPTLICAATQDFFDIEGTRATFKEAKQLCTLLGKPERVELFESETKHGYPKPHREAALNWMRRWLLDRTDPVSEEDAMTLKDLDLQCTATGQVLSELKGRSVFDLNVERAEELARQRAKNPRGKDVAIKDVLRLLAISTTTPVAKLDKFSEIQREGYRIDRVLFTTEPGIAVPGLWFTPAAAAKGPLVIYLSGAGKASAAGVDGPIEKLVRQGRSVLAIDVRGFGETAPGVSKSKSYFGVEYTESFLAMHIGRPLLGLRTLDVLSVMAAVEGQSPEGFDLIGTGAAGLVALHAAALAPRVKSLELHETLASWTDVVKTPQSMEQLASVVPGALAVYDLPDLVATIAPRTVTIRDPVDAAGHPLTK